MSDLQPYPQKRELALVGYVKSDMDFDIIRTERIYYVRAGNRPGAMQYGQLTKPIKWLLLHRQGKTELYELLVGKPQGCDGEQLSKLGFKPRGNEYWLFVIRERVIDYHIVFNISKQLNGLKKYPQIVVV